MFTEQVMVRPDPILMGELMRVCDNVYQSVLVFVLSLLLPAAVIKASQALSLNNLTVVKQTKVLL